MPADNGHHSTSLVSLGTVRGRSVRGSVSEQESSVQHPRASCELISAENGTEAPAACTHSRDTQLDQITRLLPRLAADAFSERGLTRRTYPSGSARTCLSRLKHDDAHVGGLFLQAVGCEGASNAAPNDDDISSLRQVLRRTVIEEDLRWLFEPVRLAWVVNRKPSGAVR